MTVIEGFVPMRIGYITYPIPSLMYRCLPFYEYSPLQRS